MKRVTIYTDGSCNGNPGPGGWGVVLINSEKEMRLFGGEGLTTNNRMEMIAIINALKILKHPCDIDLYTDSKYVMQGITEWIKIWKIRNWKTSSNALVKNIDLWKELDILFQKHNIQLYWVKGHTGDPNNELADTLAKYGALRYCIKRHATVTS